MPANHVLRYRLDASVQGKIPYDPTVTGSYQAALDQVAAKRKVAEDGGYTFTIDKREPGVDRPPRVKAGQETAPDTGTQAAGTAQQ